MAYQRFGEDSDLYIWDSGDALNVWIAHFKPNTKTVKPSRDGLIELKFDDKNLSEAVVLFTALYNHLLSNGAIIDIDKKKKTLKIRKVPTNG
jgi:hypothetical protein